jgi:hypothetical protein
MATVGFALIFGLLAIIGMLLLVIAAFYESPFWGALCLLVPAATFVFVWRHWERAKTGFLLWAAGMVGLIALMLSTPPREASADPPAGSARASAKATVNSCPPTAPASEGFSKWCCTSAGWSELSRGEDCSAVYKPSETCDEHLAGTSSMTACGSSPVDPGSRKKRR